MTFPSEKLSYFHAGALFTLSELAGNALMAKTILEESKGRYQAILPQDLEVDPARTSAIRDADLLALLSADVALFHFDGPELDSGTVVEFMVAKFADIPAVILRSDFRRGGDSHMDAWNLMLSDYPRTLQVIVHAMDLYHGQRKGERVTSEAVENATSATARQIIEAFDRVRVLKPVMPPGLRANVYRWLALFPEMLKAEAPIRLQEILDSKIARGLI